MLSNANITVYHLSGLDVSTNLEIWTRYNYNDVWLFGRKLARVNKGYENANSFDCRIFYGRSDNLNIRNFSIGDIVVNGEVNMDITTQQDLDGYEVYNITKINNNNFGGSPHIHIGGE